MSVDSRLSDLLLRWEELHQQNQSVTPEELCRDCPELLESLRQQIDRLQAMDAMLTLDESDASSRSTLPPESEASLFNRAAALDGDSTAVIAGYEILDELGQGGMGVVYKARQVALGRFVAIKMMLARHAGVEALGRFRREAETVARLQHPNLVQIFDVGECAGRSYYSMEFVDGGTLDKKIAGHPQTPRQAAETVETLARAMHAVHLQGIVHRDLKPSNVLATSSGILKISDFGLVKRLNDSSALTATENILGTPSYMAPEQAERIKGQIGPATDVYALGGILYKMLTGRPPFEAATPLDTILQVTSDDPVPPRRLQPNVPIDLETICLKCLEKKPNKRYASAEALAEDLRRFLAGEPILARPVGAFERAKKWAARRPAAAALLVLSLLVVTLGFPGTTILWLTARQAQINAEQREQEALRLRAEAEQREMRLALDRGITFCEEAEIPRGMDMLVRSLRIAERTGSQELAEALRVNLADWGRQLSIPGVSLGPLKEVRAIRFSPDGKRLVVAGKPVMREWDVATGKPVGNPLEDVSSPSITRHALSVAYSPDGRFALTGETDGYARLWNLATGQVVGKPLLHDGGNFSATEAGNIGAVAFSVDGQVLLSGGSDNSVRLWDRDTGQLIGQLLGHKDAVVGIVVSRDGKTIATASLDKTAALWDFATRKLLKTLPHDAKVAAVDFSPDGKTLLTGCRDGRAQLWDIGSGLKRGIPLCHVNEITCVAFDPDGQTFLTGSLDETARLWGAHTLAQVGPPFRLGEAVSCVAFSPDGKMLGIGCRKGIVRLWRAPEEKAIGRPMTHTTAVQTVAFSRDGKTILSSAREAAALWDAGTGDLISSWSNDGPVLCAQFTSDDQDVVTGSEHQGALLWDTPSVKRPKPTMRPPPMQSGKNSRADLIATTPDGKLLVVEGERLVVHLWDLKSHQALQPALKPSGPIECIALSPDGKLLATGCHDRTVHLWDLALAKELSPALIHPDVVRAVAFNPDGGMLATGCWDGGIRLWDVKNGKLLQDKSRHPGAVLALAFSPDGRRLVTGGSDYSARVWDVPTGTQLGPPLWHQDAVQAVTFSPDGKIIVTGGRDYVIQRWRVPPPPLTESVEEIAERVGHIAQDGP
jgi:WD40 repeat protein/tRNA A-37 threonylcarbamoyl transferase component Bud32